MDFYTAMDCIATRVAGDSARIVLYPQPPIPADSDDNAGAQNPNGCLPRTVREPISEEGFFLGMAMNSSIRRWGRTSQVNRPL
jgi:hypothetical protein